MRNTTYYAAELMVYFEKHNFLDIIKALLIRLCVDRPCCLKYYIKNNLRKIANNVLTRNTSVHLPPEVDVREFANSISKISNIPFTIYYNQTQKPRKSKIKETLLKFENFCLKHGIRNKLFINFPKNCVEVLQTQKCNINLINFINVTATESNNLNTEMDFKEVLVFYKNITKQISIKNCSDTKTLAAMILYNIKYSPLSMPRGIGINYVYRVIIIGRRGSGKQTQAKLLAARYNSVYVNVESLIEQTLKSEDKISKELCMAIEKEQHFSSSNAITALVWKRLMQPDTLSRGWVLVNFPKSINDLEILVKKFQIPPNRFVILHCSKLLALRRLVKQWEKSSDVMRSKNSVSFVEKEFAQYDQNIKEICCFLKSTNIKTIHVDGKGCRESIRNKIFALLER